MYYDYNYRCFVNCVRDLLDSPEVQSMRSIRHHPGMSCYDHSVFVSYVAFRLARRWKLDYRTAARAGLLHDLYLYDPRQPGSHQGNQCFAHPKAALSNAWALCGSLTPKEENIIISTCGPWPGNAAVQGILCGQPGRQDLRHAGGGGSVPLSAPPAAAQGAAAA